MKRTSKQSKRRTTVFSLFKTTFYHLDFFRMDISFRENGYEQFSTKLGTFMSVIMIFTVCLYGKNRFDKFNDYGDTKY